MGSQRNLDRALVFMIAAAGLQLVVTASENNSTQRQTIAEVHRLFPEPISYIDGYGMVSSFDNKSFFTSSWGTKGYRTRGVPVFPDIIAHDRPPLLIAHRRPLGAAMFEETLSNSELDLLPEDREALRGSYVHYSGAIWLAGKSIVLGENETVIALPFPGRYRLEAETEVRLNGSTVQPGNSISVTQTSLVIAGQSGTKLRLIWDAGVEPIARSALRRDIFAGFTRLVFFD